VSNSAGTNPFQFSLTWLLVYITVMALVCGGLVYGRWQAFQTYGTDEAKDDWKLWRFTVRFDESGPVQRKVPKSAEPPALVLMRDHFVVCLAGALLLSSVLFGTFMVFIRGALAPAPQSPNPDP
jgi:hypothetical protein